MRQICGALAVLACVTLTGCPDQWAALTGGSNAARSRAQSFASPATGGLPPAEVGGLRVTSVLIERPVGDPLLDRDLWTARGPVLPPEREAILSENGLRVRVMGGALLPAFRKALDSEIEMIHPHRLTFANREESVIPTAGPFPVCEYELLSGLAGRRTQVSLKDARCGIMVRPERVGDGRVRLWCEPQIQHGEQIDRFHPTADSTAFTIEKEVPLERFPGLGFEVVIAPNEYLVIGWHAATPGALGSVLFGVQVGGQARQRVLVIRAEAMELPPEAPTPGPRTRPAIAAEVARW